jgi:hypothetical protein
MSPKYTGGCNCGAIRYEIESEPVMAGHCQCRDCQRMTAPATPPILGSPDPPLSYKGRQRIGKNPRTAATG